MASSWPALRPRRWCSGSTPISASCWPIRRYRSAWSSSASSRPPIRRKSSRPSCARRSRAGRVSPRPPTLKWIDMFFGEFLEFDLTHPLKDADLIEFEKKMNQFAVGVIRHARALTDEEHVRFSRRLGPLLEMKMLLMVGKSKSRLAYKELIDVGNLDVDGSILPDDDRRRAYNRGNLLWHTDGFFDP